MTLKDKALGYAAREMIEFKARTDLLPEEYEAIRAAIALAFAEGWDVGYHERAAA